MSHLIFMAAHLAVRLCIPDWIPVIYRSHRNIVEEEGTKPNVDLKEDDAF